jgi:hypothetical protein
MKQPILPVKIALNDEQFYAVGLVTAEWAYLEFELDGCISQLLRHPGAKRSVPSLVLRFAARMNLLRDLVEDIVPYKVDRNKLHSLIAKAKRLRLKRDEIVHGIWMICDEDPDMAYLHSYRHKTALEVRFGPVTTDQMIRLAERISALIAELRDFSHHRNPKRRYFSMLPQLRSSRQEPTDHRFGPRRPLASRAKPPRRLAGLHRLT